MKQPLSEIIAALESGVSVNAEERPAEAHERGVLKVSAVTGGDFKPEENKAVTSTSEKARLSCSPKRGDILMTRANGSRDLVGCSVLVKEDYPRLFLPDKLWRIVLRNPTRDLSAWLFQMLNCDSVREEVINTASGSSGMRNISKSVFLNIRVNRPEYSEQAAIVTVLSTWDRGIRQLTDLIAAKLRFKQGLMQQLLTGKRRFKEFESRDLTSCELHDFLTFVARPIDRPTKAYKALGLRSHGKGTFVRFVEDPEQVQMDTLYQVKKDDLIVNITFAWEGAIAIVSEEDEEALVSHRFPTFVFDHSKALPEYLRQVVITPWFIFKMGLVSPGGAGRNRVLNKKDFLKIEIPLPEIDEQSRIASFLGGADREIAILRKSLDALKQQKKGLMQKLLTGEVRVKI